MACVMHGHRWLMTFTILLKCRQLLWGLHEWMDLRERNNDNNDIHHLHMLYISLKTRLNLIIGLYHWYCSKNKREKQSIKGKGNLFLELDCEKNACRTGKQKRDASNRVECWISIWLIIKLFFKDWSFLLRCQCTPTPCAGNLWRWKSWFFLGWYGYELLFYILEEALKLPENIR